MFDRWSARSSDGNSFSFYWEILLSDLSWAISMIITPILLKKEARDVKCWKLLLKGWTSMSWCLGDSHVQQLGKCFDVCQILSQKGSSLWRKAPLIYIYIMIQQCYCYVSKIDFRLLIVCFCFYGIYFRYVLAMCLWCFSEFHCIWLYIHEHIYVQHAHPRTLMFFNRGFNKLCEKEKPSSAYWHSKILDAAHVNETKHLTLHHDHHGERHGTRWRFFLGVSNKKNKRCLNISWIGCWNCINLLTLIWPPFLCV